MQDEQAVDKNGVAPVLQETTSNSLIRDFIHTVPKYVNGQYLYRAYVVKDGRSFEQQKGAAMDLIE